MCGLSTHPEGYRGELSRLVLLGSHTGVVKSVLLSRRMNRERAGAEREGSVNW